MKRKPRRYIGLITAVIMLVTPLTINAGVVNAEDGTTSVTRFTDIPQNAVGTPMDKAIHDLRALGVTNGVGDGTRFGYDETIKRAQFVTFLGRLMHWELVEPVKGSFADNQNKKAYYYKYIETALKLGIIEKDSDYFRPEEDITREDIALMLVRTLGYDSVAQKLETHDKPFPDVDKYSGYITIAKDLGIVNGKVRNGKNIFAPLELAKRQEAAVMMMRMYDRLNAKLSELHAFYAPGSVTQKGYIDNLDSAAFAWSNLKYDQEKSQVVLDMSQLPTGFSGPVGQAQANAAPALLNVYASNMTKVVQPDGQSIGLLNYLIGSSEQSALLIEEIASQLDATQKDDETAAFDGVVIDFEEMYGDELRDGFIKFLEQLRPVLSANGKKLYVAVHPAIYEQPYYNAYDFKRIGELADRVILMAHDYNAKSLTDAEMQNNYTFTPLTPIDEVYYALKAITDKDSGVEDTSKVILQISFATAQWQSQDGKVINKAAYGPTYEKLRSRYNNDDPAVMVENLKIEYLQSLESPRMTFYYSKDGVLNTIWYEDERSVQAKVRLAAMFSVNKISLWRLGNIPDYDGEDEQDLLMGVWQMLQTLR